MTQPHELCGFVFSGSARGGSGGNESRRAALIWSVRGREMPTVDPVKGRQMNNDMNTDLNTPIQDVASAVGSVAADLRDAAKVKFDETVTEVRLQANHAKDRVAGDVGDVAQALRRAAEELRGGSAQERTLGQVANSLADASDALRDKDLGEIVQSVSKVARDNPVLFLGGAILLGFAASRYAKATTMKNGKMSLVDTGISGSSHGSDDHARDDDAIDRSEFVTLADIQR